PNPKQFKYAKVCGKAMAASAVTRAIAPLSFSTMGFAKKFI
ncbi:MAG: hypothetical protein ACI85H_001539, partial [Paracoccaceae bacterium]